MMFAGKGEQTVTLEKIAKLGEGAKEQIDELLEILRQCADRLPDG